MGLNQTTHYPTHWPNESTMTKEFGSYTIESNDEYMRLMFKPSNERLF